MLCLIFSRGNSWLDSSGIVLVLALVLDGLNCPLFVHLLNSVGTGEGIYIWLLITAVRNMV